MGGPGVSSAGETEKREKHRGGPGGGRSGKSSAHSKLPPGGRGCRGRAEDEVRPPGARPPSAPPLPGPAPHQSRCRCWETHLRGWRGGEASGALAAWTGPSPPRGGPGRSARWLASPVKTDEGRREGANRHVPPLRPNKQQAPLTFLSFLLSTLEMAAPPNFSNLPSKPQDSLHRTPSRGRSPDGGAPPTHPDSPPLPPGDPRTKLSPYTPPVSMTPAYL